MNRFELGQIVYHKTDLDCLNPLVISKIPLIEGDHYVCEWYFEGRHKSGSFIPEVLVLPPEGKETKEIEGQKK